MVYIRRKPSSSLEKNQASEIVEDPSFLSSRFRSLSKAYNSQVYELVLSRARELFKQSSLTRKCANTHDMFFINLCKFGSFDCFLSLQLLHRADKTATALY